MKISNSPYFLLRLTIKSVTWARDSHGLYDYESRNVTKKLLTTSTPCSISRQGTEVKTVSSWDTTEGSSLLCQIDSDSQEYWISPCSEPIWLVARTMKSKHGPGFVMQEGQILKLGRVCFKVSMIRTSFEVEDLNITQDSEDLDVEIPNEREPDVGRLYELAFERDAVLCRICLNDDSSYSNPLISPCKCSGSMKYIHLACLREWLNSRKVCRMTDNCVSFSWKSIDCEICKSSIPFSLDRIAKEREFIRIDKPKTPFLVLEGIGNDKNSNKGVHVIAVTGGNGISLGRGHDADVRISDISVSRTHAIIRFVEGCFVVEDKNSKFGTLVNMQERLKVNQTQSVVAQIGRTVISFSNKAQSQNYEHHEITN